MTLAKHLQLGVADIHTLLGKDALIAIGTLGLDPTRSWQKQNAYTLQCVTVSSRCIACAA